VRDLLRAEGVDQKVGGINRFASVADVVDDFMAEPKHSQQPAERRQATMIGKNLD
jgi:hypothetical protein